jgi:hypothetical protein
MPSKRSKLIVVAVVTAFLFRSLDPQTPFSTEWLLLAVAGILCSGLLLVVYQAYQRDQPDSEPEV